MFVKTSNRDFSNSIATHLRALGQSLPSVVPTSPLSRRILLRAEAEKGLESLWSQPRLRAMVDEVSSQAMITSEAGLEQPGCVGWSAEDGRLLCTLHCEGPDAAPQSEMVVLSPGGQARRLDLKLPLLLDDPQAHQEAMAGLDQELAELSIAPRSVPVWPLRPSATTALSEGYSVVWQTSSLQPHAFEVRGPGGTARINAGGPGWHGCDPSLDHAQPVEAVAYLFSRLGLVAIMGRYFRACCDEVGGEGGAWTGMGFVFL